jgi:hypothetical protein
LTNRDKLLAQQPDKKIAKERQNKIQAQIGAIGKLYNLVIYIHASASCTTEFVKRAGQRIPLDNCTR